MEFDKQIGRAMAWHGLTVVDEGLKLSNTNFYLRNWDVESGDCKITMGDGTVLETGDKPLFQVPVIISDLDDSEISPINPIIVGKPFAPGTYSIINNARFMELIEKSLSEAGICDDVESVGSVFNRSRTFVSIPLPGMAAETIGAREFKFYLNFINSFDGSTPLLANVSNICTVCNNTLTFNLDKGGYLIKHTKNAMDRLDRLPEVIGQAVNMQREFANEFLKLESEKCDHSTAEAFFAGFQMSTGTNKIEKTGEKMSVNAKNRTDRLMTLFREGKGNSGLTWGDVLSSATDFFTHEAASGQDDAAAMWKNAMSSEFGAGSRAKSRAFTLATAIPSKVTEKRPRNAVIAIGKEALKEYALTA